MSQRLRRVPGDRQPVHDPPNLGGGDHDQKPVPTAVSTIRGGAQNPRSQRREVELSSRLLVGALGWHGCPLPKALADIRGGLIGGEVAQAAVLGQGQDRASPGGRERAAISLLGTERRGDGLQPQAAQLRCRPRCHAP